MTEPSLEDLVADFLDARDEDPSLSPEAFASNHESTHPRLLEAIRATLRTFDAVCDAAPAEQKLIGPYRILREIGRGGMGVVYEGEHGERSYAIKLLPFAPLSGPRAMERFRREMQTLARLEHENIVAVHESGIEDGTPYIVMDLIEGESLSSITGTESGRRAAEIARTLSDAVQAAHDQGILHRDLKPQNVMLRRDGTPVLLDFGLMAADDLPSLTSTGDLVGTPRYMAPERIRGEPADPRTDVYGIGMILYELLVGQPAYEQQSREMIIQAVIRGGFAPPRRLFGNVPRDLDRIVMKAAAHDPKHRYETARELADDLGRFLDGQPVKGRPPGPARLAAAALRRHPLRAVTGLAALVLVLLLARTMLDRPPTEEEMRRADAAAARAIERWLDDDDDAAARELRTALSLDPEDSIARALEGGMQGRAPREDEDDATVRELGHALLDFEAERFDEAGDRARSTLEREPANPLALVLLGEIAREYDNLTDAEQFFHAASGPLDECAHVHYALAWVQEKQKRFDEALERIDRSLELRGDSARAWSLLAKIHARRGSLDEGLAAIQTARRQLADGGKIRPGGDLHLLNIEAAILDDAGRHGDAQELFRQILVHEPESAQVWFNLALSLDTDHRVIEAVEAYEKAIELAGDEPDPRCFTSLAHLFQGGSLPGCAACVEFFDAHPEYLDRDRAYDNWCRAVEADRGKESLVENALLGIAMRFDDRGKLLAFLEEVAEREPGSSQSLRAHRLIRRLKVRRK